MISLNGRDVIAVDGKEVGSVDAVFEQAAERKHYVVVSRGGFLGFGARQVAVPLEDIAFLNNRIVLRNLSEAEIESIPEFKNDRNVFRKLDTHDRVTVAVQ